VTVWPAYTEAMYLLGFSWRAQEALLELVERDVIDLVEIETRDHRRVRELMKKYRDLPMDLADAALVAVAERERIAQIFTLDRRDFEVYRPAHVRRFRIIPET
jgi:predicted nucleic acid-binding protein